jgi:hypothetical protein
VSSPLISLFKEQLENESRRIAADRNLTKRGDFLSWWYFRRLVGLDDTEIGEILCDGFNDLGIDAIRIDEDQVVHFYQFKNPESLGAGFPTGDVDKVIGGLRLILDRRHESIANEELRGRVEEIYQTVPAGYRLHLVTAGAGLSEDARVKLDAFVESLQGTDNFFNWACEDVSSLQDQLYQKTLPTVEAPIEFALDLQPYPVRSANHDCWLFHVPGEALATLYETHGEQLLQQNIRVYQGDAGTNASIRKSCTGDEAGNFLHFNNGVTILGDEAPWDAFTRKLTIKHGQVVNGGQTIRVLHSAFKAGDLRPEVLVPVRVITSHGDKSFASNVAVNLNNQNRIEPSFLRSNDPRVLQLASALASLGWHLERREDEVAGLTSNERAAVEGRIGRSLEGRVIPLKSGSQAYVATFLRQPELAKKNPKRIFLGSQDGGSFEKVFSGSLSAENFVSAHRLSAAVDGFIRQFMTRKRRKDRVGDWKADYATVLGPTVVTEFGDLVDQVVPQSAVFLSALTFEEWVRLRGRPLIELLEAVEKGDLETLQSLLLVILRYAKGQSSLASSWPTLLKSQQFFDNVAAYLKGLTQSANPSGAA